MRVILGTLHRSRSWHDDRNAIAPRRESAHSGRTDLHDAHSFHLRKTKPRFPLAADRSGAHDHSHRRASSSRLDLWRYSTSHLVLRIATDPRVHRRLFRYDG